MITSIIDSEELLKKIRREKVISPLAYSKIGSGSPVSGQEFFDRIKKLFTTEEAKALARGIEEGRKQAYD